VTDFVVRPLPGSGLVLRAGGFFGVCADAGDDGRNLVDLATGTDRAGGDAASIVARAADLLATVGHAAPRACAAAGLADDGSLSVLLYGAATADLTGTGTPVHLSGEVAVASVHRIAAATARVRLALAGAGPPDPRWTLDAGVVPGGGVIAEFGPVEAAPPAAVVSRRSAPVGDWVRQPDLSQPFESVLLTPDSGPAPPPPDSSASAGKGVLVEGVHCKNSHFNDPAVRYCQICGTSMVGVTLVSRLGPRPPLGVLLLHGGRTVRLDSDYVIGREPADDPLVAQGKARALRVVRRAEGLSRRHMHVGLVGWTVQVTDLGSANGSFLQGPGDREPWRLIPGQPVEIQPGSRITMGRRWLRYESHRNP
jgi:hypothetical protein